MKFLVDAQLPPALARWLSSKGHQARHVHDGGLRSPDDLAILEDARATGCAVITKDEDFIHLQRVRPGVAVVWITSGNTRKGELLARMEKALPVVLASLEAGDQVVEVR